nr:DNA recombination protein RmuC [Kiritimatiellia bacterium]
REYEAQPLLRTEDGAARRPDFVVHLPQGKSVIVDSKVSLTAYERYCNAETEEDRRGALEAHVQSIRRHLEELRGKNYTALLGNRTLDFVLMCIPIESAYQTALQADPKLLYDLAQTRVVITGPSTLMITLKLIAQIWRREKENRHAEQIADRAGRLYDQVTLIVEAMTAAKKNLAETTNCFDLALARLQTGRGNLVGRIEVLRKLGAKVSKALPPQVIEAALATEPAENDEPAQP